MNIPDELEIMFVPIHDDRFEPSLKKMSDVLVPSVECLRVYTIDVPHAGGQVRLRRLNQKVIVVIHQHERVDDKAEALMGSTYDFKKHLAVKIIEENAISGIAAGGHMIEGVFVLNAWRASHDSPLRYPTPNVKIK